MGCFPFFGLQTLLGMALASLVRGNHLLAAAGTWISNPFTYLPLYWFNYNLGCRFWGPAGAGPVAPSCRQDTIRSWAGVSPPGSWWAQRGGAVAAGSSGLLTGDGCGSSGRSEAVSGKPDGPGRPYTPGRPSLNSGIGQARKHHQVDMSLDGLAPFTEFGGQGPVFVVEDCDSRSCSR